MYRNISLLILGLVILLSLSYFAYYYFTMKNVKQPPYHIIKQDKSIEIRRYPAMLIATVQQTGDRQSAIRSGFRQLADYIFGNNIAIDSQAGKKIAMTAPVLQQPVNADHWQISFVMPSQYTLDTLPKPNNANITISQQPQRDVVAIRFSGSTTPTNLSKHLGLLQNYIKTNHLKIVSEPVYAFYNPPWTLPFMRRNEIMFELTQPF